MLRPPLSNPLSPIPGPTPSPSPHTLFPFPSPSPTQPNRTRVPMQSHHVTVNDIILQWVKLSQLYSNLELNRRQTAQVETKLEQLLNPHTHDDHITNQTHVDHIHTHTLASPSLSPSVLLHTSSPISPLSLNSYPSYRTTSTSHLSSPPSLDITSCPLESRRRALELRRENLSRLQQKVHHDTVAVMALRQKVLHHRQSNLPKLNYLKQLQETQLAHRQHLTAEKKKLEAELRVELHLLHIRCSFRRRVLMHNLASIYPISPPRGPVKSAQTIHPLMCYTIRELRLPNNFNNILSSFDEEQVSTALGYVCHLLILVSKYLEVRLTSATPVWIYSPTVTLNEVTLNCMNPIPIWFLLVCFWFLRSLFVIVSFIAAVEVSSVMT